jgi:hypothetical protein
MQSLFIDLNPLTLAYVAIISLTLFTLAWWGDSQFHQVYRKVYVPDPEVHTHRLILLSSFIMLLSIGFIVISPSVAYPVFLASYLTRTIHEFIDELKYHTERCTLKESLLHLAMWITVHTKTWALFFWASLFHFEGWSTLPLGLNILAILSFITLNIIAWREWKSHP